MRNISKSCCFRWKSWVISNRTSVVLLAVMFLLLGFWLDCCTAAANDDVFPDELVEITKTATDLSLNVYFPTPENRNGYETFQVFQSNLDQAIVASYNNNCYVAFRGTDLLNIFDIAQYLTWGYSDVCSKDDDNDNNNNNCCSTRSGFAQGYYTSYKTELESAIQTCLDAGSNNNNTSLVFTGHSHGGTVAQIAGIVWKDKLPYVITFGNEPAINVDCDLITDTKRWIRFINTKQSTLLGGIWYDKLPQLPRINKLYNYGYTYIISNGGIARTSLNSQHIFKPIAILSLVTFHLVGNYRERIQSYNLSGLPIGYESGSYCTQDFECRSSICERPPWWLFWKFNQCV